jgi:putative ABC transport system substrate-binding protein
VNRRRRCLQWLAAAPAVIAPALRAQPLERVARIGVLRFIARPVSPTDPIAMSFRNALRELGYVEGRNLVFEERFADGDLRRLPALARELVAARAEVIVAVSSQAAYAARAAAPSTPIVFFGNFDPIAIGLVGDLARPGGMVTGILIAPDGTLAGKRIELLKAAVPQAARIGLLLPDDAAVRVQVEETAKAARALDVQLVDVTVVHSDYAAAFNALTKARVGAIPPHCRLRGPHPQRRQAGRSADRAALSVRVGDQPEGGQRTGARDPEGAAVPRRRGDRMRRRGVLAGVAAWPWRGALAQGARPLLGVLSPASREFAVFALVNRPFMAALGRLGYEAGHNIDVVERFANRDEARLPALSAELVALRPAVLFTNTNAAAEALAGATPSIPIIVGPAGEGVLRRLAGGSLARPSTNVTGFVLTSPEIDTKCLALLIEAVPAARRIAVLVNPNNSGMNDYPAQQAAALGNPSVVLLRVEATSAADIDAALGQLAALRAHALFVADDSHIAADPAVRARVLRFAAAAKMPVASSHQNYAHDGALLAMGPSIPVLAARAAGYVDRILKGARPADLPVELPSVFTTLVNRKAARMLGLSLPATLLARADEVIE